MSVKNNIPEDLKMLKDLSHGNIYKVPHGLKRRHILLWNNKNNSLGEIDQIMWSPDGRKIAAKSNRGKIKIWDIEYGLSVPSPNCHSDKIHEFVPWEVGAFRKQKFVLSLPGLSFDIRLDSDFSGIVERASFRTYDSLEIPDNELFNINRIRNSYMHRNRPFIIYCTYSPNKRLFASSLIESNIIDIFKQNTKIGDDNRYILYDAGNLKSAFIRSQEDDLRDGVRCFGDHIRTLEGHTDDITCMSFSFDGKFLASRSKDNRIRLWDCEKWETVKILQEMGSDNVHPILAFNPKFHILATVGDGGKVINIWDVDVDELSRISLSVKTVHYSSAKIVLVGESNVGKSCLSLRLSEDRYEELGTTHGTRFWTILPEQLDPDAITPDGKKRDIVIWDMGGQNEYRLVHQIFLNDITLALVLFDPTRGKTAFEEVEEWNKRLDKQLSGRKAIKILVGTKRDEESTIIDKVELDRLIQGCNFVGYYPISAKTGRGISELRAAISKNINWDTSSESSRPEFFQIIRDEIENLKNEGNVVVSYSDLEKIINKKYPHQFEIEALETVVRQLSLQGVVSDTQTAIGERMIILHIGEIERYAGSLIIAARNNPRGVPAIEEQILVSPKMSFPGIKDVDRLPRLEERVILECVVQLLIEHGICLRHEGLLIFPTLFKPTGIDRTGSVFHSISLYYDFSGAIDNIYSSLVAWLAISEHFGRSRLWEDRAEFEMAGKGACGLRKIDRGSGFAHLDIYFEDQTPQEMRDLFITLTPN